MSVDMRLNVHHRLLIAALVVFAEELSSSRGGAQAWTYNYSTSPSRRWLSARQWCRERFTDMVPVHDQQEADFLDQLLPRNARHYWIGVRKMSGVWTWVETSENVPEEAQNWATSEPDVISGQDCVELYIKRDKDTAKWNNEKCQQKKGTVCYSASCRQDSCSAHADCVETVGNFSCRCHPGFSGPNCEVTKCPALFPPVSGNVTCVDAVEPFAFGSRCNFTCQDGFYLTGDHALACLASGRWSKPTPTCTVVQCSSIKAPLHAQMQCRDPIKEHSYGSTCTVHCDDGFHLIGSNVTECSSQANWSRALPDCKAKSCPTLNSAAHGSLICSDPHGNFSFGSRCSTTCEEGFIVNGTADTECTSSGTWSTDVPRCLAKQCSGLKSPPHGSLICSKPHGEFSFGSRCTTTCEEGFILNGTADTECTSAGTWNEDIPQCTAKRCPTLKSPPHGSLICSKPHGEFSFGSRCSTTCEDGFIVNGTADTECTSLGTWSTDLPHCLAKRCPTLQSPPHGSLICSKPHGEFSFGSQCTTTCEEGFILNGTAETECTSAATWNEDIPQCTAKRCPTLQSPPHGSLICSKPHGEFSFGSRCTTTCEEGFVLNGTAETECTSAATWSTNITQCSAKTCPALSSPSHGSLFCSDPHGEFSFGSQCTTTCDEGFVLHGTAKTECTSLGTWNIDLPRCSARRCPLLAEAAQHGTMNCSHPNAPFSYDSTCDFECNEGFWLRGTPTTTCNTSGLWSQNLPTCQPVQCETIRDLPLFLSMNCSRPLGDFSFGSECLFSCNEGFSLNGTSMLVCSSDGFWSDGLPSCTGMSLGSAMLMYAGVGASSSVLVLILIGLVLLVMWRLRKRGPPIMTEDPAWDETENPAFEF